MGEKVINIDEELPFEIPDSWRWIRLKSVIELISGQDMTPDCYSEKENGIPYLTGASNIESETVILNRWTTVPKSVAVHNDLLITCKGTVGAMAFLECEQAHIARQFMAIRPRKELDRFFLKAFMETYVAILQSKAKSLIPGIARDNILNALFPLPSITEQRRIVSKLGLAFEQLNLF